MDLMKSHKPSTEPTNGNIGDKMAIIAPKMKSAPVVILRRVNKSFRIWTVNTLPAIKFPCKSSSRIVTVDSPVPDGSKLCQIILVELSKLGKVSVSLGEIMPSNEIDL